MNRPADTSRLRAWAEALDHVQAAISQALAGADERDRAAAEPPAQSGPSGLPALGDKLRQVQDRLAGLQAFADRAAAGAADVDAALGDREQALRTHLAAAAGLRQRVADWSGGAVG